MTLMVLQDRLCEELKLIFQHTRLLCKNGELVPLNIFKQLIPFIDYPDQADGYVRNTPCCTVFVACTTTNLHERDGQPPCDEVTAFLCFTVYDNGQEAQGHRDLMMLTDVVKRSFRLNPTKLGNEFYCHREMDVALDSRETAPYFEASMEMTFDVPILEAESEYI